MLACNVGNDFAQKRTKPVFPSSLLVLINYKDLTEVSAINTRFDKEKPY